VHAILYQGNMRRFRSRERVVRMGGTCASPRSLKRVWLRCSVRVFWRVAAGTSVVVGNDMVEFAEGEGDGLVVGEACAVCGEFFEAFLAEFGA